MRLSLRTAVPSAKHVILIDVPAATCRPSSLPGKLLLTPHASLKSLLHFQTLSSHHGPKVSGIHYTSIKK